MFTPRGEQQRGLLIGKVLPVAGLLCDPQRPRSSETLRAVIFNQPVCKTHLHSPGSETDIAEHPGSHRQNLSHRIDRDRAQVSPRGPKGHLFPSIWTQSKTWKGLPEFPEATRVGMGRSGLGLEGHLQGLKLEDWSH